MIKGSTRFSKPGVKKAWVIKILIVIGASTTNTNAGAIPKINKRPHMVSVDFNSGKKYPDAINPWVNAASFSGIFGGGGIRLKSPAAPKTKNKSPSAILVRRGN